MKSLLFTEIAAELGGVTKALAAMGFNNKKDRKSLAGRLTPHQKIALVAEAIEQPEWGAVRVANALQAKGVLVTPQAVRNAWYEYDLADVTHRWRAQRRSHAIKRFWRNREVIRADGTTQVRQERLVARVQAVTLLIMGLAAVVALRVLTT